MFLDYLHCIKQLFLATLAGLYSRAVIIMMIKYIIHDDTLPIYCDLSGINVSF